MCQSRKHGSRHIYSGGFAPENCPSSAARPNAPRTCPRVAGKISSCTPSACGLAPRIRRKAAVGAGLAPPLASRTAGVSGTAVAVRHGADPNDGNDIECVRVRPSHGRRAVAHTR